MPHAKTLFPKHQEQESPIIETRVKTAILHSRGGWHRWLSLWGAERRRRHLQRLDHLWDAQHERMWTQTAHSYRDFVLQERRPALRLAIYQHLALS